MASLTITNLSSLTEYPGIPSEYYLKIIKNLTKTLNFTVITNSEHKWKMQEIITEMGLCQTFNSAIAQYISTDYIIDNVLPKKLDTYSVNYFDIKKYAALHNVDGMNVSVFYYNNNIFISILYVCM